jgi:tryptophan-rich sensory protein
MNILITLEAISAYAAQDNTITDNSPWIIFLILFAGAFLYAIIAHKLKKVN